MFTLYFVPESLRAVSLTENLFQQIFSNDIIPRNYIKIKIKLNHHFVPTEITIKAKHRK